MTAGTLPAPTATAAVETLRLRDRPIVIFFIAIFALFIVTSIICDSVEGLGLDQVANSPNILVQWNYTYSSQYDPLYQSHPLWLRMISGTSAYIYGTFYIVLIISLIVLASVRRGRGGVMAPSSWVLRALQALIRSTPI